MNVPLFNAFNNGLMVLNWNPASIVLSVFFSENLGQHFYIIYQPQKLVEDLFVDPSPSGFATTGLLFLVMTPIVRVGVAIFNFICSIIFSSNSEAFS